MPGFRERGFSRRAVLLSSVGYSITTGLAGCADRPGGLILTAMARLDARGAVALSRQVAAEARRAGADESTLARIENGAERALQDFAALGAAVGTAISHVRVSVLFADLETVVGAAAMLLPDNIYLKALQAILPALASAWHLLTNKVTAIRPAMSLQQARQIAAALPQPG